MKRGVILTFYTFCCNKKPSASPRAFYCSEMCKKSKSPPFSYYKRYISYFSTIFDRYSYIIVDRRPKENWVEETVHQVSCWNKVDSWGCLSIMLLLISICPLITIYLQNDISVGFMQHCGKISGWFRRVLISPGVSMEHWSTLIF